MSNEKIRLGKIKQDAGTFADGEVVYLSKHKWDCGWYWGFGYLGNNNCHFHFDGLLKDTKYASELFESTNITDGKWWVIRDLFAQAYALRKAADAYIRGGGQTTIDGVTDIIESAEKAKTLNADLELVLNKLWVYVSDAVLVKKAVTV